MSRKLLISALLLCAPFLAARAQLFDPEHRLSVEVLAGTSPVQTMMEKFKKEHPDGTTYKNLMGPAATVLAVFDLNEKWTVQGGINLSQAIFDISYPEEPATVRDKGTITFTGLFAVHYSWLRRDHLKLYSGVGFGMTPKVMMATFFPTPIPSITPIGFNAGFDKIYFTAEVSAGANTLGGLAGLGFRF